MKQKLSGHYSDLVGNTTATSSTWLSTLQEVKAVVNLLLENEVELFPSVPFVVQRHFLIELRKRQRYF